MSLLDRKLLRDIVALRGQVVTIALVVAAGVAVFVASISTYQSLLASRDRFYDSARFPQVFVTLKRAPLSIVPRLAMISGVATVEPRIVRDVIVDWPSAPLPVSARVVSLSHAGDESLARLQMRGGAAPGPHDTRGAVVNEAFAEANGVKPGTDIRVILNGRLQRFTISGIALSPEYVYAVKPGLPIPDDRFFAVLWVDRSAAEAAFDMVGAFNDLVVTLAPGAAAKPVIDAAKLMIYIKDLGRPADMVVRLPFARPKMTDIPPSPRAAAQDQARQSRHRPRECGGDLAALHRAAARRIPRLLARRVARQFQSAARHVVAYR